MQTKRTYTAIDLKSFYASVECVDRGLDPMTANLIVADPLPHGQNHLSGRFPFFEKVRSVGAQPPL